MRLIGLLIVGFCGGMAVLEYIKRRKSEALIYEDAYRLLLYIRGVLSGGVKSFEEILSDFKESSFSDMRMRELFSMSNTAEGNPRFRDKLSAFHLFENQEDGEHFREYFGNYGRFCLSEEIKRLENEVSYFEKRSNAVKAAVQKDIKVACLLYATAFVSLLILIF